jgi:hypothetical protein
MVIKFQNVPNPMDANESYTITYICGDGTIPAQVTLMLGDWLNNDVLGTIESMCALHNNAS